MDRKILGFDTSGIDALYRLYRSGASDAESLLGGLDAGYAVRLNATTLDEIIAHPVADEREKLRMLCRRLLMNGEGDVILPSHEITIQLALAFESQQPFNWTEVDIRSSEYTGFIFENEIPDIDEVSAEQLIQAKDAAQQFESVFLNPRSVFQELRKKHRDSWPMSAAELTEMLKHRRPHGAYWHFAKGLFERATGRPIADERIEIFVRECPPFRALLAALMVAQFDRAITPDQPPRFAGRNDLFMSVYLPYCHEFISNDHRQQIALRAVVDIAELDVNVCWYKNFVDRFSLPSTICGARPAARLGPSGASSLDL